VSKEWTGHHLAPILQAKREAVAKKKVKWRRDEICARAKDAPPTRPFSAVLRRGDASPVRTSPVRTPRLVAEVKKASPSKGLLRPSFDPVQISKTYAAHGASALSVLTEEHFFLGSPNDLRAVRAAVTLPLLQKDFILDEVQLFEARALGADACLLIAALLDRQQARDYFDLARELTLDVLLEVHTEEELISVIEWAPLVGINNRDLTSFQVDLETTFRLLRAIPASLRKSRIVVSESGIASPAQIERLSEAGVDGVLIGETFMRAETIEDKIRELFGGSTANGAG
jgi:indole-3-glycerol phosphate synthase